MITREMLKNRPKYPTELTPDNIYIGMTVRVKTVEQLKQDCPDADMFNDVVVSSKYDRNTGFVSGMIKHCGKVFTISRITNNCLDLDNAGNFIYYPDWLETA